MDLYNNIESRMGYIQHVFMKVQHFMQENHSLEDIIAFLDSDPKEYRSVAYEGASMEIGLKDLSRGEPLKEWNKFYLLSKDKHSAHMEVGLGWAFGKLEITPNLYLKLLDLVMPWMVYDGIGYYYGLFKGRRTVKHHEAPEFIIEEKLHGFDQGLGRRLWYIGKGESKEIAHLIQSFPVTRHEDLWRGVGIACGYVGGNEKYNMEQLVFYSGTLKKQLSAGVAMAALSRSLSDSITDDIDFTCSILCGKSRQDVILATANLMKTFNNTLDNSYSASITQLMKCL